MTQNLATALRHLWSDDEDNVFWIDAIYIDQSNDMERCRQVALMGGIYRMARGVVFWLGPKEDDSDYAMYLIHDFSEKVRYVAASDTFEPTGGVGETVRWCSPEKLVSWYSAGNSKP